MSYLKKYDFSSVGELDTDFQSRRTAELAGRAKPVGIETPLQMGADHEGLFKMHKNMQDQIADNFRNLLMTNHGDRYGLYDFGANLSELAFEMGTEDGDTEAMRRIARATKKYMSFISLENFEPLVMRNDKDIARIGIRVSYRIPKLESKRRAVEVVLFSV